MEEIEDGNLNLARIGECGLKLVGATYDEECWRYPYPIAEKEKEYLDFLYGLATMQKQLFFSNRAERYVYAGVYGCDCGDAFYAYTLLYDWVKRTWGKQEEEFTALPIELSE